MSCQINIILQNTITKNEQFTKNNSNLHAAVNEQYFQKENEEEFVVTSSKDDDHSTNGKIGEGGVQPGNNEQQGNDKLKVEPIGMW